MRQAFGRDALVTLEEGVEHLRVGVEYQKINIAMGSAWPERSQLLSPATKDHSLEARAFEQSDGPPHQV